MKVSEIFYSLQGEGTLIGVPTTFVRFAGCNLDCTWCDTKYAREGGEEMSMEDIINKVDELGAPFICLTGGEPMLQDGVHRLIEALLEDSYHVTVETNGAVALESLPSSEELLISMDIKCPSSGMSHRMVYDNLSFLSPRDQLKFVIADRVDYLFAKKILREREVNCPVIMTPVGGTNLKELAKWVLEDHLWVRVLPQLHKIIWGDQRGV